MQFADLHDWADLASVLTFFITFVGAGVGILGYIKWQCGLYKKSKRLEEYLRSEKTKNEDQGQPSLLRIIRDVGMTQDEIIQASFQNSRITRRVTEGEQGLANALLFEYIERR